MLLLGLRDESLTSLGFLHHIHTLYHILEVGGAEQRKTDQLENLKEQNVTISQSWTMVPIH